MSAACAASDAGRRVCDGVAGMDRVARPLLCRQGQRRGRRDGNQERERARTLSWRRSIPHPFSPRGRARRPKAAWRAVTPVSSHVPVSHKKSRRNDPHLRGDPTTRCPCARSSRWPRGRTPLWTYDPNRRCDSPWGRIVKRLHLERSAHLSQPPRISASSRMTSRQHCDPFSTPLIASRPTTPWRPTDCRSSPARRDSASSTAADAQELQSLKLKAVRQGRAVGAVIGFFLKFKPFPMLEEIRRRGAVFQPPFGPVLVVDGAAVRDVLERDQEFTVEPYGVEMMKVMSPAHNGGFSTFILSTDDNAVYEPDKRLLSAVCNRRDADTITEMIHEDCVRRVGAAVAAARKNGSSTIDVVQALARYVPVTLGHRYLGVPVAAAAGILRADPRDAVVLRDPDRRAARHRVDGTGRGDSGRAADVPLDQGRVSALLQQRAEGSRSCRCRGRVPAGSCSPTSCARLASSVSVC